MDALTPLGLLLLTATLLASPSVPATDSAVVAFGDRILVIGGRSQGRPLARVAAYDPLTGSWQDLPALRTPRYGHVAGVLGDRVYVFGGVGSGEVEVFDGRSWTRAGRGPERAWAGLFRRDGELWLVGGEDSDGSPSASVDRYQPGLGAWSSGPPLPRPRSRHAAAVYRGVPHVLGGEEVSGQPLASGLRLEDGGWTAAPPMSLPRSNFAAATLGPRLVVAGNGSLEGFDGAWERLGSTRGEVQRLVSHKGRLYGAGESFQELRWQPGGHEWEVDRELRFHLAYLSEEAGGKDAAEPLGYTPWYRPDIDNIGLEAIRNLGFPLPDRPQAKRYKLYLKFFRYPEKLDPRLSARRVLHGLLVDLPEQEVVVKGALIAPADRPFTPESPFPPFFPPARQDAFDARIPFSSVYVDSVSAFHKELLSEYRESFLETRGPDPESAYFLDEAEDGTFRVLRVRKPLVFANFRDLPMPQAPGMVLSELLLVYDQTYAAMARASGWMLASPIRAHVFEVGSVRRLGVGP
ncbi:MAG: hypothetical protein HY319_15715 [Armatimonadetes bacterium]|nr:hypothetical protein [Armatimonadota bacterium]